MMKEIGPQYEFNDSFKATARLHQSKYRAEVLGIDYLDYGNRLTDSDGRALLNYYDGLGIRSALRKRYPDYARRRDADLLRSEHIPFNMLAPFAGRPDLARKVIRDAFQQELEGSFDLKFEWAPEPKSVYLDDMTSFDAYIQGVGADGELMGIGIEVKYTERGYRIGKSEKARVDDPDSTYWATTRESGLFTEESVSDLADDDLRQIWRNHLLGLAMVRRGDIKRFVSITLYPSGNVHFTHSLARYQDHLKDVERNSVIGCTFERFIECIRGAQEIKRWKQFLIERYLIEQSA
jgi:hypothetical protein